MKQITEILYIYCTGLFSCTDGATEIQSDVEMQKANQESMDESKESRKDRESDCGNDVVHGYNPKLALKRAIEDWIPEFYQPKGTSNRFTAVAKQHMDEGSCDRSHSNISTKSNSSLDAQSQQSGKGEDKKSNSSDSNETKKSVKQPSQKDLAEAKESGKRKIEELEPLSKNDVETMCDLFYLPFQHGSRGVYLLKEAHWLVQHAGRVKDCYKIPQSEQVSSTS